MVQGRMGWSSGASGSVSPAWRTKAAQQTAEWDRRVKRARPVDAPAAAPPPTTAEHPVLQVPRARAEPEAPPRRRWAPSPLRRAMASARVRWRHDPPPPEPGPEALAAEASAATGGPGGPPEPPPPPPPAWATRDARRAARGAPRRRFCD